MDTTERTRLRALCEAATPGPECTGITAMWCPRCGDCTCPGDPDRGDPMDDPRCPLHAANSPHGEGEHEDKVAAVATLASWRKLIVDTAAALGQTMPPCVWYDHGNLARLAADVVRQRDEARAELDRHRQDIADAAGELLVAIPEPGTEKAKLLRANVLMRRERDEARATAARLRREGAEAMRAQCIGTCERIASHAAAASPHIRDESSGARFAGMHHGADLCASAIRALPLDASARGEGGAR